MNRRQALKLLAAVPIASVLNGCKERERDHEGEEHPTERLEIHLDGAFAVVIRQDKANSILAFSPRPANGIHELHLNENPRPEDTSGTHHFELLPDGLRREVQPDINVGLRDFYFESHKWLVPDSLIVLELPCPKTITFSGRTVPATFADGREAWMPTNHILQYDLKREERPRLTCSELKDDRCAPAQDSPDGLTRFFFEVGPKRTTSNHPVEFFNYILQTSFPDLEERYRLAPKDRRDESDNVASRVVPAVWHNQSPSDLFKQVTYTVDCKFAGPLVRTTVAPSSRHP